MAFKIKTLHITVGLPASGKTTWALAEQAKDKYSQKQAVIHLDNWLNRDEFNSYTDFVKSTLFRQYRKETTIIDGLFLTVENVDSLLTAMNNQDMSFDRVVIHKWDVDRETCIWNDLYRREKGSGITISNANLDTFNREELKVLQNKFNGATFSKVKHLVEKKAPCQVFADKYDIIPNEDGYISGQTRSGGGTWNDCWDNGGRIEEECAPQYMDELYDILHKIDKTIDDELYYKIFEYVAWEDDEYEDDYYGGRDKRVWDKFSVEGLYNYLVELEIIEAIT